MKFILIPLGTSFETFNTHAQTPLLALDEIQHCAEGQYDVYAPQTLFLELK